MTISVYIASPTYNCCLIPTDFAVFFLLEIVRYSADNCYLLLVIAVFFSWQLLSIPADNCSLFPIYNYCLSLQLFLWYIHVIITVSYLWLLQCSSVSSCCAGWHHWSSPSWWPYSSDPWTMCTSDLHWNVVPVATSPNSHPESIPTLQIPGSGMPTTNIYHLLRIWISIIQTAVTNS